jgi:hypothetical protein
LNEAIFKLLFLNSIGMGAAFCFLEFEDEKDAEVKIVSRGKI